MAGSRTVKIDILGSASGAQKAFGDAEKAAGGLGSKLADVGKIAAGFVIGQAITQLPGLLTGGANAAIALEQNARKAATVFGDSLGTVQSWASTAASGMGLTNREAVTLAASMADLLVPMGFTRDAAADMATKTLDLAGALSEWSGGQKSAAEVADILTAAMLGETDGLKALGIGLSADEIATRAAQNAKEGLTFATEEQAKAYATQQLILEKSTDAQNAYATSTNDLASRKARLTAIVQGLKERFQLALLPAMEKVFGLLEAGAGIVTRVTEAFDEGGLLGALGELRTLAGEAAEKVKGLAADLLDGLLDSLDDVADFGTRFGTWIADKIGAVDWTGKLAAAGGKVLDGLFLAFDAGQGFGSRFATWAAGKLTSIDWTATLASTGSAVVDGLIAGFDTATDFGGRVASWVADKITNTDWSGTGSSAGGAILDGIVAGWEATTGYGGRFVSWFVGQLTDIDYMGTGAAVLNGIVAGWNATTGYGGRFVSWFWEQIKAVAGADWGGIGSTILDGIVDGWNTVTGWGQQFIDWFVGAFTGVEWKALGTAILDGIVDGWNAVEKYGQRFIDWFVGTFEGVEWKALGQAILDGIADGWNAVEKWGQVLIDWIDEQLINGDWSGVGQTITDKINEAIGGLQADETSASLIASLQPFFDMMRDDWTTIVNNFASSINAVRDAANGLGVSLGANGDMASSARFATEMLVTLALGPITIVTKALVIATTMIDSMVVSFSNAVLFIREDVIPAFQELWDKITDVWDTATGIPGIVTTGIGDVKDAITGALRGGADTIQGVWDSTWDAMLGKVQGVIDTVKSIVGGVIGAVNGVIGAINSALTFNVSVPNWVPVIGGNSWSFSPNLPTVDNPFGSPGGTPYGAMNAGVTDPGFLVGGALPGTGGGVGTPPDGGGGGGGDPVKTPKPPPVGDIGGGTGTGGGVKDPTHTIAEPPPPPPPYSTLLPNSPNNGRGMGTGKGGGGNYSQAQADAAAALILQGVPADVAIAATVNAAAQTTGGGSTAPSAKFGTYQDGFNINGVWYPGNLGDYKGSPNYPQMYADFMAQYRTYNGGAYTGQGGGNYIPGSQQAYDYAERHGGVVLSVSGLVGHRRDPNERNGPGFRRGGSPWERIQQHITVNVEDKSPAAIANAVALAGKKLATELELQGVRCG